MNENSKTEPENKLIFSRKTTDKERGRKKLLEVESI